VVVEVRQPEVGDDEGQPVTGQLTVVPDDGERIEEVESAGSAARERVGRVVDAFVERAVCDQRHSGRHPGDALQRLGPRRRRCNVGGSDAVQVGIREVESGRRSHEPGVGCDDSIVDDLRQADRADGCTIEVGGLEVDGDEVQGHLPILGRSTDSAEAG